MEASKEKKDRMKRLKKHLVRYIPPRETWTAPQEALHKPVDLVSVPLDEAQQMQIEVIKYALVKHYKNNDFIASKTLSAAS